MNQEQTLEMTFENINEMPPQEISKYILQEYYKENMEPFFEVVHPQILFLSVGTNQIIEGSEELKKSYAKGNAHQLEGNVEYDILSFSSRAQRVTSSIYNTLTQMQILTKYPSGELKEVNQRVTVNWRYFNKEIDLPDGRKKAGWFAMQIHVSVGLVADKPGVDVKHLAPSIRLESVAVSKDAEKYLIRDIKRFIHYVQTWQIVRISVEGSRRMVYMQDGTIIPTHMGLSTFEKDLGDKGFVRSHNSHVVNLAYVRGMCNYKLTLVDGNVLPIPRGKVDTVRRALGEKVKNKQTNVDSLQKNVETQNT